MTQTKYSRALSFLHASVGHALAQGKVILPSIERLARDAGVGRDTMWKAVQEAKHGGVLSAAPRRGLRVVAPPRSAPHDTSAPRLVAAASLRVADQIRKDILSHRHVPGDHLPSAKVLCHDYRTSFRTLKGALEHLRGLGVVARRHRGYCIPAPWVSGARNRILLVAAHSCLHHSGPNHPDTADTLKTTDQECRRRGLRVEMLTHDEEARDLASRLKAVTMKDTVLGAIVVNVATAREAQELVLESLLQHGLEVAVMDHLGWFRGPSHESLLRKVSLYTRAGYGGAQTVGRYLIGLGHRRFAYLTSYEGDEWSRLRLEGLREAVRTAGITEPVCACSFTEMNPERGAEPARHALVAASVTEITEAMSHVLSLIADRMAVSVPSAEAALRAVSTLVGSSELRAAMRTQLEVIRRSGATAVVTANDICALALIELLSEEHIAIPGMLSVASFDDTLLAMAAGLTSYNFNLPAIVGAMLDGFLGRRSAMAKRTGAIELSGFVAERRTTGPLRARPPSARGHRRTANQLVQ